MMTKAKKNNNNTKNPLNVGPPPVKRFRIRAWKALIGKPIYAERILPSLSIGRVHFQF